MFEQVYPRKFHFLIYTQDPPMLKSMLTTEGFFEVRWSSSAQYFILSAGQYSKVQH